jgi:hypothetical protein
MTGKTSTAITSMKDNKISPLIAKKKGRKKNDPLSRNVLRLKIFAANKQVWIILENRRGAFFLQ